MNDELVALTDKKTWLRKMKWHPVEPIPPHYVRRDVRKLSIKRTFDGRIFVWFHKLLELILDSLPNSKVAVKIDGLWFGNSNKLTKKHFFILAARYSCCLQSDTHTLVACVMKFRHSVGLHLPYLQPFCVVQFPLHCSNLQQFHIPLRRNRLD